MKCRWPISNPGAEDFCFCGNEPVKGLPYCPGHARIAYRQDRQRRNAGASAIYSGGSQSPAWPAATPATRAAIPPACQA
jgi:hypothetical protein